MAPPPPLRLRLLGTPGLEGPPGAAAGTLCHGQPLALLAVLACAGERGLPRDKLVALFWPEASADRAAHRLNQLTHSVRRRLGAADPIAGTGELRLDPERIACDLWDILAARRRGDLERAVEFYAGPLLDGFFLPDNPEVERWLEARRSALGREHGEMLEALAVQAELRGDTRAAAAWWHRLAEHEPLSSRVVMHLMTALAASGDRARALEQARAYEVQVREELEAEPNPEVLALATQLRTSPSRPVAIGVLPIEALDEGAEARRFAQGLTEELTSAAANLPAVRVAARSSLLAVRRESADLREVGARLGLTAMLEGTIRSAGPRVRLLVRLVDVRDGCQVWSGRFEREMPEGFEGQEALAGEVIAAIRDHLAEHASPKSRPGHGNPVD
ncbi:MAG TPA: BTAD domain-containing putative transcriptional regulator [Gemmatimonadales bacterium]|nr:BTAD domain-containing putative transcriptional regulator [Gemmatimonadales bacterium]